MDERPTGPGTVEVRKATVAAARDVAVERLEVEDRDRRRDDIIAALRIVVPAVVGLAALGVVVVALVYGAGLSLDAFGVHAATGASTAATGGR